MQIQSSQPTFKGRCGSIRDAQDVCRAVRNNFAYISPTKQGCDHTRKTLKKDENIKYLWEAAKEAKKEIISDFLREKQRILNEYRDDRKYLQKPSNYYKEVLFSTIHEKIANCNELATLTELFLRMKGFKNCGRASLVSKSGIKLDHCVTYIQLKEKFDPKSVIILDSWLQDADFLNNMLIKYKHHYKDFFTELHPKDTIKLDFKKPLSLIPEEIEYFKNKYPNFDIKHNIFEKK